MKRATADKIIDAITKRGFWQGNNGAAHGATCLLLAFDDMTHNYPEAWIVADEKEIVSTIQRMFPDRFRSHAFAPGSIVYFNDHPDTTVEDVFAVVRACVNDEDQS